jgi:hypothetical protein
MNIIGIVGKAGSGKDTVADILVRDHGFCKIALADPMKRACREFFDFTDDQLWGPSEMRNEVDDRWPRPRESHRLDENGRCHVCFELFPPSEEACFGGDMYLSPRVALQQLGTQWGRAMSEDIWINKALKDAAFLLSGEEQTGALWLSVCAEKTFHKDGAGERWWDPYRDPKRRSHAKGVVIPDVRFPNELRRIREVGGKIWRRSGGGSLEGAAATHISETALVDIDTYDAVIPWLHDVGKLPGIVKTLVEEK